MIFCSDNSCQAEKKIISKITRTVFKCPYCETMINSSHARRHMQRNHTEILDTSNTLERIYVKSTIYSHLWPTMMENLTIITSYPTQLQKRNTTPHKSSHHKYENISTMS